MRNFMLDEATQNSLCPPSHQQFMAQRGAVDEIVGGVGEFGRDIRNPIPVNGFMGELVHISMLALPGGSPIMGHRLGSLNMFDVYEMVALDGSRWDILFFDMYHTGKSKRLPSGYQASLQPFYFATNDTVPKFPYGMNEAIWELTRRIFGIPFASPQLREEQWFQEFSRPQGHLQNLQALMQQLEKTGAFYIKQGREQLSKGEINQAIDSFTKAMELDIELPDPYNYRGILYGLLGQYDQTISDYTKALEIHE
jgi:hypothetical protein